jgi:malate dehydrogenase (oxaloacetate-decarboxylating)(NADP+)
MSVSSRRMTDFNPLSSVDVSTIEQAMKASNLDQLRGYAQNHYAQVNQDGTTEYIPQSEASGYQVLSEPLWNKGKTTPQQQLAVRRVCCVLNKAAPLQSTPLSNIQHSPNVPF